MDFTLRDPATGKEFIFPVNPEEVQIRREKQYETLNVIGLGEIDFPQQEKVREIAFSSFFPAEYDPSYCKYPDIPDPQIAMNQLTSWLNSRQPIRLIISETAVNVLVLISAHNSTLGRGGDLGDVFFDVTFRTWRDAKVRKASNASESAKVMVQSARTDTKPVQKVYTVKSGDTLSAIAKRELGSSSKWKAIYEKNKSVIGNNPNLIRPGQKLVMP